MAAETRDRTGPERPPPAAEEADWVRAAQRHDRQAFARLVEAYWGRLFRWLFQLTGNRHLAEDLAQEAFLKALAHLHRFRAGTNFKAWLFRIAHNAFANHARADRRRTTLPDDLPAPQRGPVEAACGKEAVAHLAAAIDRLPTDFRAALLLRVEEELSFREIAAVLDTTEETARWRVFKARQKLLDLLGPPPDRETP
ncbi:MAG: sigma-70 family RNA polymerase sigma factor [Gemmataceae bacterium]